MKNTGENTGESIKTELKEDKGRDIGRGEGGFKGTWSCCHGWSCQCSICRRVLCCRRCLVARICTSHSTSRKPLRTRWALSVGCTCPCTTLRNLWTPNKNQVKYTAKRRRFGENKRERRNPHLCLASAFCFHLSRPPENHIHTSPVTIHNNQKHQKQKKIKIKCMDFMYCLADKWHLLPFDVEVRWNLHENA